MNAEPTDDNEPGEFALRVVPLPAGVNADGDDSLVSTEDFWDQVFQTVDDRVREHLAANPLAVRRARYDQARTADPLLGDVEIRKELAARGMARGWSQRSICAVLAISTTTMCRWAKSKPFRERVASVKAERDAMRTALMAVASDPKAEPVTRLRASENLARLVRTVLPEPEKTRPGSPEAREYLSRL